MRSVVPERLSAQPAPPPLIAVTSSEMRVAAMTTPTPEGDPQRREMALGLTYLEAIEAAGGLPVVVPPLPLGSIDAFLDRVDGVCLSGGPDIDPAVYGAGRHPRLGPTERALDEFELELARAADERDMPVLAICRGAQVVNVARGGTLHQHLPDVVGETLEHRQDVAAKNVTHPVTVDRHSLLGAILGQWAHVNSFHHQAVRDLGSGLIVTATAPDGTIEAFEAPDRSFLVGVQWHAECLIDRKEQADLFDALMAAATERRDALPAAADGGGTARMVLGEG
jgi:putative glutamine amidotransferase